MDRLDEVSHVYLPDDLLRKILGDSGEVAASIRGSFNEINRDRRSMREQLLRAGRIGHLDELPPAATSTVSAVDGGIAIERSFGADTIMAVAVGVEGLMPPTLRQWDGPQYLHWQRVITHSGEDARRFSLGIMAGLELQVLSAAPQQLVILDGSHATPVIGLNSMLTLDDPVLTGLAVEFLEQYHPAGYLYEVVRDPRVVGIVKYDASQDLSSAWFPSIESAFDDRTVMTLLLEPGEYIRPVRVGQTPHYAQVWSNTRIGITVPDFPAREQRLEEFREALEYVRQLRLYVTYFRPRAWSPAYRLEIKEATALDQASLSVLLRTIQEQVLSPEIREPYPQYLVDVMAKSVGPALTALRDAVLVELSGSDAGDYLALLGRSYRSEV